MKYKKIEDIQKNRLYSEKLQSFQSRFHKGLDELYFIHLL